MLKTITTPLLMGFTFTEGSAIFRGVLRQNSLRNPRKIADSFIALHVDIDFVDIFNMIENQADLNFELQILAGFHH